ncbi:hypothetical protein M0804_007202 [Polistes exclamans]|nr:hypothetical protein M0804_007202 [Polistes exclamans]
MGGLVGGGVMVELGVSVVSYITLMGAPYCTLPTYLTSSQQPRIKLLPLNPSSRRLCSIVFCSLREINSFSFSHSPFAWRKLACRSGEIPISVCLVCLYPTLGIRPLVSHLLPLLLLLLLHLLPLVLVLVEEEEEVLTPGMITIRSMGHRGLIRMVESSSSSNSNSSNSSSSSSSSQSGRDRNPKPGTQAWGFDSSKPSSSPSPFSL